MNKIKARWFWLAFFLTMSTLWNFANPALSVFIDVLNFSLFVMALIKSIPTIKSFFKRKETTKE